MCDIDQKYIQECIDEYAVDNLDLEIWKTIVYPDSKYEYQVSNYGRFRNKTTGNIVKPYYKITETFDNHKVVGYYRAVIHTNDPHKTWKPTIHRLVAIYFVKNPDPVNFVEVDHKDGNRFNNHYTNLEWVTQTENLQRAFDMKLRTQRYGEDNAVSKWKDSEVRFIWSAIEDGKNYHEVYDAYMKAFPEHKSAVQTKNLFYNLLHKTNPKWTHITNRKPA